MSQPILIGLIAWGGNRHHSAWATGRENVDSIGIPAFARATIVRA